MQPDVCSQLRPSGKYKTRVLTHCGTIEDNTPTCCSFTRMLFHVGPEMNLPRYKYVVQVVIGEQRGEGVRMGSRCFWDSETDNVASETYVNVRVVRPPKYLTTNVCMRVRGGGDNFLLSLHPAFHAI